MFGYENPVARRGDPAPDPAGAWGHGAGADLPRPLRMSGQVVQAPAALGRRLAGAERQPAERPACARAARASEHGQAFKASAKAGGEGEIRLTYRELSLRSSAIGDRGREGYLLRSALSSLRRQLGCQHDRNQGPNAMIARGRDMKAASHGPPAGAIGAGYVTATACVTSPPSRRRSTRRRRRGARALSGTTRG